MTQLFLSQLKLLPLELEGSLLLDWRKIGPYYYQVGILNTRFHRNCFFVVVQYS